MLLDKNNNTNLNRNHFWMEGNDFEEPFSKQLQSPK